MNYIAIVPEKKRITLTKERTEELVSLAQAGDIEARNELLLGNMGIIILAIARAVPEGMDRREIFGELFLIAIRCVYAYRKDRGAAFPSYLARSLDFGLRGIIALHRYDGFMIPCDLRAYHNVTRVRNALAQSLCHEPTAEQVAEAAGVGTAEAVRYMTLTRPASLDQPIAGYDGPEDAGRTLADVIPDDRTLLELDQGQTIFALEMALDCLDIEEKRVISEYTMEGRTLREVAGEMGIAEVQVARIRDRALGRLRRELAETG